MATNNKLKAYVRYDGSGRVIPGSLILNRFKPKVGNWQETPAYLCCNPAPPDTFNFDITANWSLTTPAVVDETSFRTFLESGIDGNGDGSNLTDVVITNFSLVGNRLTCNLSANGVAFYLGNVEVLAVYGVGDIVGLEELNFSDNQIVTFNPSIALPSSLLYLYLQNNQIGTFNPTIALPSSLQYLDLSYNQIVTFNPSIPLPNSLVGLYISNNQITSFDPSIALPNSITELSLNYNQIVTFDPTLPLPSSLIVLNLDDNQIVTFNPTISLPSSLFGLLISGNQIVTFDPSIPLPNSLVNLILENNQIVTFNPTIPLPNSLVNLYLQDNQIVTFNPSISLPNSLVNLYLDDNQMTTAGYTGSEPWANAMTVIPSRGNISFSGNIDTVSGTNLETILISKGWTVNV